jgi:glycine hydroxymethyltransferase
LGTPAITTRGVKEKEIELIVELIDEVLSNIDNEKVINNIRTKVNDLMKNYPLFA